MGGTPRSFGKRGAASEGDRIVASLRRGCFRHLNTTWKEASHQETEESGKLSEVTPGSIRRITARLQHEYGVDPAASDGRPAFARAEVEKSN